MDDLNRKEGLVPAVSTAGAMKQKYGKVYRVGVTVPVDDETEQEISYFFKRPSIPVYDRFVKTMSKVGISKASRTFILDSIVDKDRERLIADMEEYPGISITIGNKLGELLDYLAKARFIQQLEQNIVARAIAEVFASE